MEIIAFLFILILIVAGFKLLGFLFKAAIFMISIPLQILLFLFLASIIFAVIGPLFTGLVGLIIIPLGLMAPLLPILLIALGVYLLAHK
ncbi:hypothetical protein JXO52_15435 [bacterium]|nr:hypothetical protein [bacterium]